MTPPIHASRFAAPLIRGFFSHTFSLVTTCPARNVSRTSAYEVLSIIITTLVKYITACNITTLLLYYWLRVSLESVLEAFCTVYMDVFLTTSNIRVFFEIRGEVRNVTPANNEVILYCDYKNQLHDSLINVCFVVY